ncbi:hypothetical protein Hypma_001444 [Hypsizygus marmoreus]|uniref:Uncharacterized protein n=1 Tax=Hypsizygus marmoreus TaxID=39966 RepID=A0A369K3F9_HYPMA|nr:hypothetical protein Hypma_001444 [Hypsizygus marmoreus]
MLIVPRAIVFIILAAFLARLLDFESVRDVIVQWRLGAPESIRRWREAEARKEAYEAVLKEYIAEARQLMERIEVRVKSILGINHVYRRHAHDRPPPPELSIMKCCPLKQQNMPVMVASQLEARPARSPSADMGLGIRVP